MIRTSQNVSIFSACVESAVREPVDREPEGDADRGGDDPDHDHLLRPCVALGGAARCLLTHARRILWVAPRQSATTCDVTPRRDGAARAAAQARLRRRCASRRRSALEAAAASGRPTATRRGGGGRPWRTGPAGGSRPGGRPRARSVPRSLSMLGGALHPHRRQVLAERRVADLGVRALQLAARGGDAAGDVVERRDPRRTRSRRSRASSKRLVRWRTVAGRCMVKICTLRAGPPRMKRPGQGTPTWRVAAGQRVRGW